MKPDEDQEEMLVTYTLMQKKRPLTKFEEDLGVSSEYDRRIYDSPSARREFHESQFKGNKTTISSDGYLKHIEKYQLTGQIKTTLDIPPAKK